MPLPEEWALCAQTDPYIHIGYIPEEGKNTSVYLFPVAVTTCHGHPSCPLKPWFGVRWSRSHEPCVWHSNNSLGKSYPWLRRSVPLIQGQQMQQRRAKGKGRTPTSRCTPTILPGRGTARLQLGAALPELLGERRS